MNLYQPPCATKRILNATLPLIATPDIVILDKIIHAFVYLFDVYPTVCELVGAKVPEGLEGRSLAPIIQGRTEKVRDSIFLAYKNLQRAVRRGRWKLLRYPQVNKTQLFNLRQDPHERKNLADDPDHTDKVEELMVLMGEQQKFFGDTQPLSSESPKPCAVDIEFFKNLPASKKTKKKKK